MFRTNIHPAEFIVAAAIVITALLYLVLPQTSELYQKTIGQGDLRVVQGYTPDGKAWLSVTFFSTDHHRVYLATNTPAGDFRRCRLSEDGLFDTTITCNLFDSLGGYPVMIVVSDTARWPHQTQGPIYIDELKRTVPGTIILLPPRSQARWNMQAEIDSLIDAYGLKSTEQTDPRPPPKPSSIRLYRAFLYTPNRPNRAFRQRRQVGSRGKTLNKNIVWV